MGGGGVRGLGGGGGGGKGGTDGCWGVGGGWEEGERSGGGWGWGGGGGRRCRGQRSEHAAKTELINFVCRRLVRMRIKDRRKD